jgi:hypothetical protein
MLLLLTQKKKRLLHIMPFHYIKWLIVIAFSVVFLRVSLFVAISSITVYIYCFFLF